jgi:hypothetical protein
MKVRNYIQKIDLRRTFTEFSVRVRMSGGYGKEKYRNYPILTLKYDVTKPVDLYISYNEKNQIVDAYLYLERTNFKSTKTSLKVSPKKNWIPTTPITGLETSPILGNIKPEPSKCVCECYAGSGRFTYYPVMRKNGEDCNTSCVKSPLVVGCAAKDSFYAGPTGSTTTYITNPASNTFRSDVILPFFADNKLGFRTLTKNNITSNLTNSRLWTQQSMLQLRPLTSPNKGKSNQIEIVMPQIKKFLTLRNQPVSFNVEMIAFNNRTPVTQFTVSPTAKKSKTRKVKKAINNLYTKGYEYQTLDGKNYIGWYHIHPEEGASKGKSASVGSKARLKSLSFIPSIQIVEPKIPSVVPPSQTFYVSLKQKEIEKGKVDFNYNTYIPGFRQYKILKNEIFIIKNDEKYSLSLCNFLNEDVRELPYNVSRVVTKGNITAASPYYVDGVKKYPLSWPVDLSNNEIFSDCKQCMSFSFYSNSHKDNFGQILRQNQIANLESDYFLNEQKGLSYTPRFYTGLNQWLERSSSDIFSDLQIIKDSKGELDSLQLCPSKDTILDGYSGIYAQAQNKCICQYSDSTDEEIVEVSVDCKSGDCAKCCSDYQEKNNWEDCWTCEEHYSAPIGNYATDLFTSTYASFKEVFTGGTTYSGYTNTGTTSANTYDIYISASTFSGTNIIPISNIDRIKHRPLVNTTDPRYVPHYGYQVFSGNGGNLTIQSGDSSNYMVYRVRENGTYRFQYNAYLDVSYEDSKWADYVFSNYLTAGTKSISYPSTDYAVKRLINASVLRAGQGEGKIVEEDTNGEFFPGKTGFAGGSGITSFNFNVFLERQFTGGSTTNLDNFSVSNDAITGVEADSYLTQQTNIVQNTFSGYSNLFASGGTGNTVFRSIIPVSLDSGLISLSGGDVVRLKYMADWSATSKGTTGSTAVKINLGHRLNISGNPTFSPSYRVVKFDNLYVNKTLFFNAHKKSRAESFFNEKGEKIKMTSQGALYTIDTQYKPLTPPVVNKNTFNSLTFVDNVVGSKKLELKRESNKPTNQWARQLISQTIEDYYLPLGNLLDLEKGHLTFNLPRYDQDFSLSCNYTFPQIDHSYVIKTTLSDSLNHTSEQFVVITPSVNLQVPCFTPPLDDQYKLVKSEFSSGGTIEQFNGELLIDGKEAIIKTSRAQPLTTIKAPNTFRCQFYCVCDDLYLDGVDPYFGTTSVITDNTVFDCDECEGLAANYCGEFNKGCRPVVFSTACQPTTITNPQQTNFYKWTCSQPGTPCTPCTAEFLAANPGVDCPYSSCTHCEYQSYYDTSSICLCQEAHQYRYNCGPSGDCIIDNDGPYLSLEECEDRCSWFIQDDNNNINNNQVGNYANPMLRNTNISGGY